MEKNELNAVKSCYVHNEKCYAVPTNSDAVNNACFLLRFVACFSHLYDEKQKRGATDNTQN